MRVKYDKGTFMYCSICGTEIDLTTNTCQQCDSILPESIKQGEQKPIAVLKPVLMIWLIVARYLMFQINFAIVGGVFGGLAIFFHQLYIGVVDLHWQPFVYAALFCFFAVPIVAIFIHKRTYDLTRYVFYPDHLEYYEGFWNIERKIIQYKAITEVELRRTVIQRLYHLGSIYVLVPAMSGEKQAHTGIMIADIKNYDKAYQFLQKVIRGAAHE